MIDDSVIQNHVIALVNVVKEMNGTGLEMTITDESGNSWGLWVKDLKVMQRCRVCGCTDMDCRQCIEASGQACYWVEDDLCSRCYAEKEAAHNA